MSRLSSTHRMLPVFSDRNRGINLTDPAGDLASRIRTAAAKVRQDITHCDTHEGLSLLLQRRDFIWRLPCACSTSLRIS